MMGTLWLYKQANDSLNSNDCDDMFKFINISPVAIKWHATNNLKDE